MSTKPDQVHSAVVGFTYDSADRRTVLTLPNGVTIESAYDVSSQVTGLTYKLGANTLGDLTYTYDLAGNRTTTGGSWARTGLPTALASATYDAANHISTWGGTSFTYDNNGNLTNDGSKTYTWNVRNQLTALSSGASASFQYDGAGRRRAKTISGTSTSFLYDGVNAVQEITGGSATANILAGLGIDQWLKRTDSTTTRLFLTDPLGSTIALADGSGTVQTEYTYGAFGTTTISGGSTTNRSGFTGREDDGTGLHHYRARYYDSLRQRFVSEDPIGFAGGLNVFEYGRSNPLSFRDPTGLLTFFVGLGGTSTVGAGFEASGGRYWNPGCGNGGFSSAGVSAGANVSAEVFGGFVTGALAGDTINVNVNAGPGGVTVILDPNSFWPVGVVVGVGPTMGGFGASVAGASTSTTGSGGSKANCDPDKPPPPDPPGPPGAGRAGGTGGGRGTGTGEGAWGRLGGRK